PAPGLKIAVSAMAAAAMAAPRRSDTGFHHVHGANVRIDATRTQATRVESFAHGLCFSREPLAPGQVFLVEIEEKELGWCGHLRVGLTAHDPQSLRVVPEYSLPDLVSLGDTWVFAITRSHNRDTGGRGRALRWPGRREQALRGAPYGGPRCRGLARAVDAGSGWKGQPGRRRRRGSGRPWGRRAAGGGTASAAIPRSAGPRAKGRAAHTGAPGRWEQGRAATPAPSPGPLTRRKHGASGEAAPAQRAPRSLAVPSLQTLCRLVIRQHVVHRLDIDGLALPPLLKTFCKE
ncbi:NEUL2 protein, partial [Nothocercus nigrocapillus]|nr:NEUL2 protein [Nothocercus nigrocapillus]